ncbi:hypothetical protein HPP92_027513 [Vanilla planifolia]|uniref:Protein kinase domain-containing protein n=1 Tax=Vanilla planifolia TaxID=51239 RepID=A0A835U7M0_VANPL|nr:hypothetical protein HPP92_027513 [Vanilla planifolia]
MLKLSNFCCASNGTNHEDGSRNSVTSSGTNTQRPWEVFTLRQLLRATHGFHEDFKLGEGGFGVVYWGRIASMEIAVKRIKAMTTKAELEFAMEVEVLGRVRHKNLLGLRGYYASGKERLIVYDYMPNRSLLSHLHGSRPNHTLLSWHQRMHIALGSASGIAYLHHEASPRIIHRDIKASNVLLDSRFRPKVADFGFAKLIPEGVSHLTSRVKGTVGYLAPEYAMWGSFGILLLELVTARRPFEKLPGGERRDIVKWVQPLVESGDWEKIADPRLSAKFNVVQLRNVVVVAMKCTNGCPDHRPEMREVVQLLRAAVRARNQLDKLASTIMEEINPTETTCDEVKKTTEDEEPMMITEPSEYFFISKEESMMTMMR